MSRLGLAALGLVVATVAGGSMSVGTAKLPSGADTWIQVETDHFTLYSNASESKTKEVGLDLEKLRAVLLIFKETATANSPVPTFIFVFKSDSAFEAYKPFFQGKPRRVLGYFQPTTDGNYIALTAAWNTDLRPLIYHEYLHYFMHANFLPQPTWYDEGLAEFYSTFQAGEKEALVGRVVENHLRLLREVSLLPLQRLFAVRQDSPEYNEESRQGLFYAESWALVHYLMRGEQKRTQQLGRFLVLLQQGKPPDDAFREAFQMDYDELLGKLAGYIRGTRFLYTKTKFTELKVSKETKTRSLSYEDAVFHLGDLLAHGQAEHLGDAEAYFQEVLGLNPSHTGALATLGLLRMRQERYAEATELLQKAVASGTADFRAYFHYGSLLMHSLSGQSFQVAGGDPKQRELLEQARSAFRKSVELNGNFPEARAALGRTYLFGDDSRLDEGIGELEVAVRMLPSRRDLATDLATLYDRKGERAKSEELLKRALGPEAGPALARRKTTWDFEESVARVNKLLAEKKEDEAIALLEQMVSTASGDVQKMLSEQLNAVRHGAARNRSVRQYNEALARWGRHDLEGALSEFQKVAATAENPALAKTARENAERISRLLPMKQKTPRPENRQ